VLASGSSAELQDNPDVQDDYLGGTGQDDQQTGRAAATAERG
jgi:hypothetical protein